MTCAKEVHSDPSIRIWIYGGVGGRELAGGIFFFTLGRAALPGRPWYGCLEEVFKGERNGLEGFAVWFVRRRCFVCLLVLVVG